MPIPTADLLDKESQQNTRATTSASNPPTESNSGAHRFGAGSNSTGDASRYSQNAEGDQALSREEADRLYEERMEEEYAKREGGA